MDEYTKAMFGDSVTITDNCQLVELHPHFLHTPGYVYAYAFGELLVLALFNLYRERGAAIRVYRSACRQEIPIGLKRFWRKLALI